jgi:hypothetical protein
MSGITDLTIEEFQAKINRFEQSYVEDWNAWIEVLNNKPNEVAKEFGRILRKWQACRPNSMRRIADEAEHGAPFLEDLINQASEPLRVICAIEMQSENVITDEVTAAIYNMWYIFELLSYQGRARNGLTGIVGISKAVLLLTEGRIGPAFDSQVSKKLQVGKINSAEEWVRRLKQVARDISVFEQQNNCRLNEAAPGEHSMVHYGRLYDMTFGPGNEYAHKESLHRTQVSPRR